MNLEQHAAGENIYYLRQGIELIGRLDEGLYTHSTEAPFRGGVGSQFRHCIDFYSCLLDGLEESRVDYSCRERNPRVESQPAYAADRIHALIGRLAEVTGGDLGRTLQVRSDIPATPSALPPWSTSTVHRELQFLVSHTVHHYALIVSLLREQGFELGPQSAEFGVAPSTLHHWKEADLLAT